MSDETTAMGLLRKLLAECYTNLRVWPNGAPEVVVDGSVETTPEEVELCKRIWVEVGKLEPEEEGKP